MGARGVGWRGRGFAYGEEGGQNFLIRVRGGARGIEAILRAGRRYQLVVGWAHRGRLSGRPKRFSMKQLGERVDHREFMIYVQAL